MSGEQQTGEYPRYFNRIFWTQLEYAVPFCQYSVSESWFDPETS